MTTEAAFLRTIAEAGDDLSPRLVFADWLDEHGHAERAVFVRESDRQGDLVVSQDCGAGASRMRR